MRIVREADRQERQSKAAALRLTGEVDDYYLSSSRLMLRDRASRSSQQSNNSSSVRTSLYSSTSSDDGGAAPRSYYPYKSTPTFSASGYQNPYQATPAAVQHEPFPTRTRTIQDARDQMISMGFSDDDGWLTQLLTLKHGNIEQVIEILSPVKNTTPT